jgi:hypothetical protein
MTNLVDRYVYTALRRVPEEQRADIDQELRASIEDEIEARVQAGDTHDAAVESTLLELGDPDRLADRYANRPNHLIGPELFPVWRRLLATLYATVLPIVVTVSVVVQLIEDPDIGKVIGDAVTALITVGVHLAFWTTAFFAVLERTGQGKTQLRTTWSLKDLPTYQPGVLPLHEAIAAMVWSALVIAALILQQFTFSDVPVLDPAHWTFLWPFLIVVIALRGAWSLRAHFIPVWTRAMAAVNAVLALLIAVPMIWMLAADRFFNPEFDGFIVDGTTDVKHWVSVSLIVVVALSTAWDIFDVIRKTERSRRGLPTKVAGTGNTFNFG